jgi:ADP-dependent NAD(P)H-hydrate dehydratase / NAD(P)H-hydrate epimerase
MKAVSCQEMRRLDETAINRYQIPGLVLMENAGRGAFVRLHSALQERNGHRVLVMCGPGNNGGDGYVVARHLANAGYELLVLSTCALSALKGDALVNSRAAANMDISMVVVRNESDIEEAVRAFGAVDAVCDALLGTGVTRALGGIFEALVGWANRQPVFRFAVDLPTGVHADDGQVPGIAFRAHETATFGLPKIGLLLYPGAEYAGQLSLVSISIPAAELDSASGVEVLTGLAAVPEPPGRTPTSYKNTMGHLLLIAGSPGKAGTALLAGKASLRTGAGLCTVATHGGCRGNLEGQIADLMVEEVGWERRPEAEMMLLLKGKTAVAVGPGIGTGEEAGGLVKYLLQHIDLPKVLDADALTVLAGIPDILRIARGPTIITPHPGELARMLGVTSKEIQGDRLGHAIRVAADCGAIVVLKGARTIIAHPDGRTAINLSASAALAKAGSGDVLTGILGALLAMGMPAWDAARYGVVLHGRCGEKAGEELGLNGVLASDLIEYIPKVTLACD